MLTHTGLWFRALVWFISVVATSMVILRQVGHLAPSGALVKFVLPPEIWFIYIRQVVIVALDFLHISF